jgi:hypothetical protein
LVTKANKTIQKRQYDMDSDAGHGAKTGVPYGDVLLDESVI